MPIIFQNGVTSSVQSMKGGQYLLLGGLDPNGNDAYYGPYIVDAYNVSYQKYRYLEINPRFGQEYIQLSSGLAPVSNYLRVSNGNITMTASSTIGIVSGGTLSIGGTTTTLGGSVNMVGPVNSTYQSTATVSTTSATPTALVDVATTTNSAYVVWGYVIGEHNTGATAAVGGRVEGVFRNTSGTLVSVGVGATVYEDLSGTPTFALTTSGTNIRL